MASFSCQCGQLTIKFPTTKPRITTECCCNHCFARVMCLEERGGPKVLKDRPLINTKWDNLMTISCSNKSVKENLRAYKMRDANCGVTNIASSCCNTFLLGRNPAYDTHVVTTMDDFVIFSSNYEKVPPSSRWFVNQWSSERISHLPHLPGLWVSNDGNVTGEDDEWEQTFQAQLDATGKEPPKKSEEGMITFDDVLDLIGRDQIEIVSWKKEYEVDKVKG